MASGSTSRRAAALAAALALLFAAAPAGAKVFYSRSQALELAFPDAERVEDETFVLSDAQVERIQSMANSPIDSKLVKIYTAIREGRVIGHAVIKHDHDGRLAGGY